MGNRLLRIRRELGLSRERMAEQIGLSPRCPAGVECNAKGLSTAAACRACGRLSVSADCLLFGRGARNPDIPGECCKTATRATRGAPGSFWSCAACRWAAPAAGRRGTGPTPARRNPWPAGLFLERPQSGT